VSKTSFVSESSRRSLLACAACWDERLRAFIIRCCTVLYNDEHAQWPCEICLALS
jgi:hypothetical protein